MKTPRILRAAPVALSIFAVSLSTFAFADKPPAPQEQAQDIDAIVRLVTDALRAYQRPDQPAAKAPQPAVGSDRNRPCPWCAEKTAQPPRPEQPGWGGGPQNRERERQGWGRDEQGRGQGGPGHGYGPQNRERERRGWDGGQRGRGQDGPGCGYGPQNRERERRGWDGERPGKGPGGPGWDRGPRDRGPEPPAADRGPQGGDKGPQGEETGDDGQPDPER